MSGCGNCGTQLPRGRRRWCTDGCRHDYYVNHKWAWARDTAMVRAGYRCRGCGARATEVDHIAERKGFPLGEDSCLHHQGNLRALCHHCHVNRRTVFPGDEGRAAPAPCGAVPSARR